MSQTLTITDNLTIYGCRICSIGNRGHHNFGDELILVGLMKLLIGEAKKRKSEKAKKLYISGGDLGFLQKFHHYFFEKNELENISYLQEIPHGIRSGLSFLAFSPFSFFAYLKCDTFIAGGGELFTEETPGSYLYRFWSLLPYRIRKIFFWNTKLYLMGGFQKPTSRYNRAIAWLITKSADGCYMRDEESCRDILLVCPGKKNVEWFIDTSYFALEQAKRLKGEKAKMREVDEERSLDSEAMDLPACRQGSNLASRGWRSHIIINSNPLSGKRTDELIEISKNYLDKGYTVYFLPAFFTSNPQQDDMKVYEYCRDALHASNYLDASVILSDSEESSSHSYGSFDSAPLRSGGQLFLLDRRNRDEFLIIFHSAEKIFCSRLHVFLIAAFLGLNVEAYPYQKKIAKNISILKKTGIIR